MEKEMEDIKMVENFISYNHKEQKEIVKINEEIRTKEINRLLKLYNIK